MIYVTNTGSNTVSVIDGSTNKMVVGVDFSIDPPNSGRIECINKNDKNDTDTYTTDKYVRLSYGKELECTSYSNSDYRFNFWSGDLATTSTSPAPTGNILGSVVDWFKGLFISKSPPITFAATEYNQALKGNFKAAPDYISAVILPILIAALTFGVARIRRVYRRRRHKRREENYLLIHNKIIDDAYNSSQRSKTEASQRLTQVRNDIVYDYAKGITSEGNYKVLMNNISNYLQKIASV
jgi:YVTN family beta-propeller protein